MTTPHELPPTPRTLGHTLACLVFAAALPGSVAAANHSFITDYTGTQTCLGCHGPDGLLGDDKTAELMHTVHWTWQHTNQLSTGETQDLGKAKVINNYCVATSSNEPRCTSCHIGQGWRDDTFDFEDPNNLDCLVCHDTTGTYKKTPTGAGMPDPSVDLLAVARGVGGTSRATCGACHFYGGGGDAVKHGDLDSTMTNPTRDLDVHMGVDGLNQNCAFCHDGGNHEMLGSRYSKAAPDNALCEGCHTDAPHSEDGSGPRLDSHTARVACQTCHIPQYARGGHATKMSWDWSTAGDRNPDGSTRVVKDANGDPIYHSMKGTFTWEANVIPEYRWFGGDVLYHTLDDLVDPDQPVTINRLLGEEADAKARIVPVKRFTGIQPYDAGKNVLGVPNLFPNSAEDTDAYWKSYDWVRALTSGMASVDREFSGELGWAASEMFWVQNHMVAPKEKALKCADCHTAQGRLDFLALGYPAERAVALQNMIPQISVAMVGQPGGVQLVWKGLPGFTYQVQVSGDVSDPANWTDATDGTRTPGDTAEDLGWADDLPATADARFYRVLRNAQ